MNSSSTLFTTTGVTDSNRILHTPGLFAKNNMFYVQEVGRLKSLTPHQSKRENLDSFLFLSILSGEGIVQVGEKDYKVKKGECGLINCQNFYMHESSETDPWELIWVHFNGEAALSYYQFFMEKNKEENFFRPSGCKNVQDMIDKLMNYQKEKDLESELLSGELLQHLMNFCLISVMNKGKENSEQSKFLCKEMREYINANYQQQNLPQVLADKFKAEEEKLNEYFQKIYGIGLYDYIRNRQFTAAKELLRFTIKPMQEIIEESGISDDTLFRRLFTESESMSPEEYRMKWSQWVK